MNPRSFGRLLTAFAGLFSLCSLGAVFWILPWSSGKHLWVSFFTLLTVANLLIWWLLARGLRKLSSWIIAAGYWSLTFTMILFSGGLASPWLMLQLAVTVLAGILLGPMGTIGAFGLFLLGDILIVSFFPLWTLPVFSSNATLIEYGTPLVLSFILVLISRLTGISFWAYRIEQSTENNRRYNTLFQKTNDAVFIVSKDETVLDANDNTAKLLGFTREELIGKPYLNLVEREESNHARENFRLLDNEGVTPLFERTLVGKDGRRVLFEINASTVYDEEGKALYYLAVARDIREKKRLEQELHYSLKEMEGMAKKDALTGLFNRRAIIELAELELGRAHHSAQPLSILLIDLDNLKSINDTHGHLAGDQVLQLVAKAINESKRRSDWAGRWGGDEFMVVLPATNLINAKGIADRLCNWVKGEGSVSNQISISISVGIACYSGRNTKKINELFDEADHALYAAKKNGRDQIQIFRPSSC